MANPPVRADPAAIRSPGLAAESCFLRARDSCRDGDRFGPWQQPLRAGPRAAHSCGSGASRVPDGRISHDCVVLFHWHARPGHRECRHCIESDVVHCSARADTPAHSDGGAPTRLAGPGRHAPGWRPMLTGHLCRPVPPVMNSLPRRFLTRSPCPGTQPATARLRMVLFRPCRCSRTRRRLLAGRQPTERHQQFLRAPRIRDPAECSDSGPDTAC